MTKILGVGVRDAPVVSSGMFCTLKGLYLAEALCVHPQPDLPPPWQTFLSLSPLQRQWSWPCLWYLPAAVIPLFILKQTSSYFLSFCPSWKKLPLNIHFSPWSLASLLSFALTCTCWRSRWECLWRPMSAGQLWRYRGGPGAETFLVLLTLALCMPRSCETAEATGSLSPLLSLVWIQTWPALSSGSFLFPHLPAVHIWFLVLC